jgi:methionyl-tRNA formyltransferase
VRLVFLGTPADAVPALRALHDAGHEIALVVTQPDRRRGRGSATGPSPVRAAAEELGLPVRTPARAREVVDDVRASGAELGVVVAFGQLLPPALLEALPLGFVNLHFSLLPRWRGAAPVERAILAGDAETGVCVMQLEEGLDTGPVYDCVRTPVDDDETAGELRARLAMLGTALLVRVVPDVATVTPASQVGEPTHAAKVTVDEFRLDPARGAATLARLVRAGNPRPGAWTVVGGRRLKVLRAHVVPDPETDADGARDPGQVDRRARLATADGVLALDEVQPEGKAAMVGGAWRAGIRDTLLAVDPPVVGPE